MQLYGPLNQLGYIYRSLNSSLVDTEKLLKLLSEPVDIVDKSDAHPLLVENGEIEFGASSFLEGAEFGGTQVVPQIMSVSRTTESHPRSAVYRSKYPKAPQ